MAPLNPHLDPRLWVLLVADPSRKKTPVINTALALVEVRHDDGHVTGWTRPGSASVTPPPLLLPTSLGGRR